MSYRRLAVLLDNPAPDSAYVRSLMGDDVAWTPTNQLLAGIFDVLRWANYQRGGGKGVKPQPLERPGVRPERKRYGGPPMSLDEAKRRFSRE